MSKLKRIYSYNDKYESNESCMLEDLFKNNKLEYVDIYKGNNIVKSMTISTNIQNLRFFYINNKYRVDITLDISTEYPKKLVVY